jgi:hypothetical protein
VLPYFACKTIRHPGYDFSYCLPPPYNFVLATFCQLFAKQFFEAVLSILHGYHRYSKADAKRNIGLFAAVYGIKRQYLQTGPRSHEGNYETIFTKSGCYGPFGAMDIIHSGEFHPVRGGMDRERGARCTEIEGKELTGLGKV